MSFVTAFMAVMTAFVLLAPLAMAAVLVAGGVTIRPAAAPASPARADADAARLQGSSRART